MIFKMQKARDPAEDHRAATMLELFFDLVSVVAIAAAATGLHHMLAHGHVLEGVIKFTAAFVSIWWAWVNYTWYASAFDADDTPHRIGTMVIMAGALIMAAGVHEFFEADLIALPLAGYVVLRLGLAFLFWRAASANNGEWRKTATRYGLGLVGLQILWVTAYFTFEAPTLYAVFSLLFLAEFLLPTFAEAAKQTPWHRHHIIERYNLLNIIVLGESLLAVSFAIQAAYHGGHMDWSIAGLAASGMITVCAIWWLYYDELHHLSLNTKARGYTWVYGHIILFASGAAIGAGLAVMVEVLEHKAHISPQIGIASIAVPAALYLFGLWFIHGRFEHQGPRKFVLPLATVLLLLTPFSGYGIYLVALILVLAVMAKSSPEKAAQQ